MAPTAPESRRCGGGGAPRRPVGRSAAAPGAMREAAIFTSAGRGLRAAASLAAALAAFIILGGALAPAEEAAAPAAGSWYSPAQAEAGQILFNNYCAECHRPDLTGADGPALKGPAFLKTFGGQPLSDLYGIEHTTMPAVNPGSLPDAIVLPITAFILEQNGLPAGEAPLDKAMLSRTLPAAP